MIFLFGMGGNIVTEIKKNKIKKEKEKKNCVRRGVSIFDKCEIGNEYCIRFCLF